MKLGLEVLDCLSWPIDAVLVSGLVCSPLLAEQTNPYFDSFSQLMWKL